MYIPRKYQEEGIQNILKEFEYYKVPFLAVFPVGSGKSWIMADVIKRLGDPPTLILQPNRELLLQNYDKYTHPAIGGNASLYSASVNTKVVSNVTFATIGSIKTKHDEFQHVKYIIIDEAHLNVGEAGMIAKFIKKIKGVKVLGVTATPIKLKNYMFNGYSHAQLNILTRIRPKFWHKIIHVTQVKELYDESFLCPLRFTSFDFDMRNVKTKGNDYDMEELSKKLQKTNVIPFTKDLIKAAIARGKRKILVFTPTVSDAYDISRSIDDAEVISSDTKKKDRAEYVENFKEKDLKVLLNYGTLTTGFDAPEIDLIICLRPTKSYALYYQILGRGMRPFPGKEICDVVDLSGNYKEFGNPKHLMFEDHDGYGWGMFVKNRLLSGIPLGQKIKKEDLGVENQTIQFGKWKGSKFSEIPTNYLMWIRENMDLTTDYAKKYVVPPLIKLGLFT